MPNRCVYIHEYIDIIGHNRARYMHHMTANWCPVAREQRRQLCFGVWGTVGSTGAWPEVVNLWELPGWEALADDFAHELASPAMQDPSLAEWWAQAAEFRRGGVDRILVPEPWSPTVTELTSDGVRGALYAHELVEVPPGGVRRFLDAVRDQGRPALEGEGLTLVGAHRVAMTSDFEAVLIWAIPSWAAWASVEQAWDGSGGPLGAWRREVAAQGARLRRTLLVDAPLSPLRLGRQPEASDRLPLSEL